MSALRFLATCPPGFEVLLKEELEELLKVDAQPEGPGVVAFEGDLPLAARALVRTRIASKILMSLRRFSAKNPEMLYDQVRRVDWPKYFHHESLTMAVFAHGSGSGVNYKMSFAPLKIKDAVCDEIRKHGLERPNVARENPDVRLEAFIHEGRCELSMDLSGVPLHKRGYREEGGAAPLRENRAAALLRFAGYDGGRPFVDPFCGSGTIALEAALIATKTAPGLLRPVDAYAFARILKEGAELLEKEYDLAEQERVDVPPYPVIGSDFSKAALKRAFANAERAGLKNAVSFEQADSRALIAPEAVIATNPPWGERLGEKQAAAQLVSEFTRQVKHACTGSTLAMVVEQGSVEKSVGFKPSRKLNFQSGGKELRFLMFEIFAGRKPSAPTSKPSEPSGEGNP